MPHDEGVLNNLQVNDMELFPFSHIDSDNETIDLNQQPALHPDLYQKR